MQSLGLGPVILIDLVEHERILAGYADAVRTGARPTGNHGSELAIGKVYANNPLILDLGSDRRVPCRAGAYRDNVASEEAQGIELVNGDLAERPTG